MKLIAIDGNSLMYRAYFALPNMTTRAGMPTGAVFGFTSMLLNLIAMKPDYMLVAFDMHGPTFRHLRYDKYKAGRKPTPDELRTQIPVMKTLLGEMGITVCECEGYEADDILGTITKVASQQGVSSLIVTGDRDALQLIDANTHVMLTKKGVSETIELDEALLLEQFKVTPPQVVDLKALMGDSSDNIPGIPGVGEKTALALLEKYGTANNALEHAADEKGALRKKLEENGEFARLSYELATICREAPINISLDDCSFVRQGVRNAIPYMTQLEIRSLIRRLETELKEDEVQEKEKPIEHTGVSVHVALNTEKQLDELIAACENSGILAIHTYPKLTLACNDGRVFEAAEPESLLDVGLTEQQILTALKSKLEDENIAKLVFDAKQLMHRLTRLDIRLCGVTFDAMIVDYLLHAIKPSVTLKVLAETELGHGAPTDAEALLMLVPSLMNELELKGLTSLYEEIELPLVEVLFSMERTGFRIDSDVLAKLSEQFANELSGLMEDIYEQAGEQFSILSPKQLGHILFDKLGLPPVRKTKTGYSTDSDTLEALSDKHPIVNMITKYRFISKLKSTFIDGMEALVDKKTGRIHTSFNQTVTATGRISSTEPNLQNIPVRTEQGREIRRAFIADEGNCLIGADYSQIELRVLAHMSDDPGLIGAFTSGADIHRRTASEVFGVPFDEVTSEQRSAAKAVNFGIVYGISDYGLAQNLGISRARAAEYIKRYLGRYKGVDRFMKESIKEAKQSGCAVTLLGRRRDLPELSSSNFNTRAFGERVAMNMPIQGTAADIIKLAMVRVYKRLAEGGYKAKIVLQVHDELIIDCPLEEKEEVSSLLLDCMENAYAMRVPLVADVHTGNSWYDTK